LGVAPFEVEVAITSRRVIVRGDLDLATSPQLAAALEILLRDGGSSVSVDMAAVSFIDSVALSVLVDASNRLAATGGRIRVVHPSRSTTRLLQLTGLSARFAAGHPDGRS